MAERDIWRYCTAEQVEEVLRSFRLLQGTKVRGDRYMACLYAVSNHIEKHYHIAVIPKKNGGTRKLSVPDILLRTIQRNIVKYVLPERFVSQFATAYRLNASVLMNACPHVGTEQVLKLDIRDFFSQHYISNGISVCVSGGLLSTGDTDVADFPLLLYGLSAPGGA